VIVFTDLETTGLSSRDHTVLEIASIITDDKLNELSSFHRIVHWWMASDILKGVIPDPVTVNPYVLDMHMKNGLWLASSLSRDRLYHVDAEFAVWIKTYCPETGEHTGPQLAGNTINFDRSFLQSCFPESHALLHYRNIDVTTLNEYARRFWPSSFASRPQRAEASHRAMDDVRESLATARHYSEKLHE